MKFFIILCFFVSASGLQSREPKKANLLKIFNLDVGHHSHSRSYERYRQRCRNKRPSRYRPYSPYDAYDPYGNYDNFENFGSNGNFGNQFMRPPTTTTAPFPFNLFG